MTVRDEEDCLSAVSPNKSCRIRLCPAVKNDKTFFLLIYHWQTVVYNTAYLTLAVDNFDVMAR